MYEWKKSEKAWFLPKSVPEFVDVPESNYLTIRGSGNPNNQGFGSYVEALFSVSYGVKFGLKKDPELEGYFDYTVYPLEGLWSISEEAQASFNGTVDKNALVFTLMIKQPSFVTATYIQKIAQQVKNKTKNELVDHLSLEILSDGPSVQMLHLGSFDSEPESFSKMEQFAQTQGRPRIDKRHREIYLSDFRRVPEEKRKTVLRFRVSSK